MKIKLNAHKTLFLSLLISVGIMVQTQDCISQTWVDKLNPTGTNTPSTTANQDSWTDKLMLIKDYPLMMQAVKPPQLFNKQENVYSFLPKSMTGSDGKTVPIIDPTDIKQSQHDTITASAKMEDVLKNAVDVHKPFTGFNEDQTITLSLRDADIREVLREIAREAGHNVVIDNSVQGTITADLNDLNLNEAFDVVLTSGELEARPVGNTVIIASRGAMLRKGINRRFMKYFKLSNANAIDVASILNASVFNTGIKVTSSVEATEGNQQGNARGGGSSNSSATGLPVIEGVNFQQVAGQQTPTSEGSSSISSADNKQVRASIPVLTASAGFNEGATLASNISIQSYANTTGMFDVDNNNGGPIVIPDTRSNSVLVVGTEKDIFTAEETINKLDKKLKQVSFDVALIEMTKSDALNLGVKLGGGAENVLVGFNTPNFSGSDSFIAPGPIYTPGGNLGIDSTTGAPTTPFRNIGRMFDPQNLRQNVGLATPVGGATIGVTTIENLTRNFMATVNTLLTSNKAKLLANPNVIVLDGTEALVKITDQIISRTTVTVTETGVQTDVELADVGVVLNLLPKVGEDGTITMKIRPSVTTPFGAPITINNITVTLISTREVILQDTRVKNGETLVLAGLINETEQREATKLPFLGDLPIVGALFRTSDDTKAKKELIIMITPRITDT